MKGYRRLTLELIGVWFLIVLSASALRLFGNSSNGIGVAVGLTALAPIVVFSVWFALSIKFRRFALSLSPRALTFAQSWRMLGFVFLLLEAHKVLPAFFALPAGYGDLAIGVTASLVAAKLASPSHRNSFLLWQILGTADLVMAVSLGVTARMLVPQGISMASMTVLPLSLVPCFIVPLLLIFHVICITQAKTWKSDAALPSASTA